MSLPQHPDQHDGDATPASSSGRRVALAAIALVVVFVSLHLLRAAL